MNWSCISDQGSRTSISFIPSVHWQANTWCFCNLHARFYLLISRISSVSRLKRFAFPIATTSTSTSTAAVAAAHLCILHLSNAHEDAYLVFNCDYLFKYLYTISDTCYLSGWCRTYLHILPSLLHTLNLPLLRKILSCTRDAHLDYGWCKWTPACCLGHVTIKEETVSVNIQSVSRVLRSCRPVNMLMWQGQLPACSVFLVCRPYARRTEGPLRSSMRLVVKAGCIDTPGVL